MSGCSPQSTESITDVNSEVEVGTQVQRLYDNTQYNAPFKRIPQIEQVAPIAKRIDHIDTLHGISRDDPYHWLKDQGYPVIDDQPVLDYLVAENEYYQAFLEPRRALVNTLFEEFKGRMDATDVSVPFVKNGFEYRYEYSEGADYKTLIRKEIVSGGEQVYLDLPSLAKGEDYFVLGDYDISPDNQHIVYTIDTDGSERYVASIKDLKTGKVQPNVLTNIREDVLYVNDGKGIVYAQLHEQRWATKAIHYYDTLSGKDTVLLSENDEEFSLDFSLTSDERFLVIYTGNNDITEAFTVPVNDVTQALQPIVMRDQAINAQIDHANDHFYILTNDQHVNNRLAKVASASPEYINWETVIAGSDTQYLKSLQTFNFGVVLHLTRNAVEALAIQPYDNSEMSDIEFTETIYDVRLDVNPEFITDIVRVKYESMVTPASIIDVNIQTKQHTIRKQQRFPSGYNPDEYITTRLMAPAQDGALIPVSIVHHKDFKPDGKAPVLLYAYGAYGVSMSPNFSITRLSMLDRGFAYAIAHTRGGDEMGYQWYLDGKMDKRQNAFNDFVDVANFLVDQRYTSAGNISIMGGSAGGKMMGAVVTMTPNLWRSVLLAVPFVDVLNTMLDASLPLTPPEWSEWGNPITDKVAFERLLSYSPYDQIEAREYPPMMVTGGLNDPRVTYWEPAKWTAKMRHTKTDDNLLIMRMNMSAGHYANSGRYGRLLDKAEELAFILAAHQID